MNDVQNQRLPLLTEEQQKYIAWLLTSRRSGDDDMRVAGVLSEARVDLNPHQVEAALFALKSPFSKGVVLADEVGLGKTIEAGIVISQYAVFSLLSLPLCSVSGAQRWKKSSG